MKPLKPPVPTSALIGFDAETDEPVAIGDNERRSGLYILGRSGMGKTELLLHLLDYDLSKGHGVFFLDPNGDAIEDLIPRHISFTHTAGSVQIRMSRSLYLLDPSNEDQAFGINLLACDDVESRDARARTYAKVRRVFDRLWEKELRQDLRPWLSLYLENTLYAFVENQDYTLAELPLFLDARNIDFRRYIVGNVRHNPQVTYFWEQEFARSPRDQQERADALLTRVNTLLDPDVRHIVGQRRTTIDFAAVLAQQSVVLVRFPPTMPEDNRRFISTILLSELVYAIQRREELDKTQRRQFCVFIDEFQTFASSEDIKFLFSQSRKYSIATTIAHQKRFGQFADNKPIAGATDGAANKVMFQLIEHDADEVAPEFAKEATHTEMRLEPQLVLSRQPFADLLRGHTDPEIRAFVNKYIRPLEYRSQDIPFDIQVERAKRAVLMDEASLFRIDDQSEGVYGRSANIEIRHGALGEARGLLSLARDRSIEITRLHERARSLRNTVRYLNHFMTATMEGIVKPGHEAFSNFLTELVDKSAVVYPDIKPVLALYISLMYRNPTLPRAIPIRFARLTGLYSAEAETVIRQAQTLLENEKAEFRTSALQAWQKRQDEAATY